MGFCSEIVAPVRTHRVLALTDAEFTTRRKSDWTIGQLDISGCYVLIDLYFNVLYIGESACIWKRMANHANAWTREYGQSANDCGSKAKAKGHQAWEEARYLTVIPREGMAERKKLERSLQSVVQAKYSLGYL